MWWVDHGQQPSPHPAIHSISPQWDKGKNQYDNSEKNLRQEGEQEEEEDQCPHRPTNGNFAKTMPRFYC